MGTLPVLIKNWVLKLLVVLGIVLPIVVPGVVMRQTDSVIDLTWVRVIFLLFSFGLILLPFTGLLRDIVKILPMNFIFNRFASRRDRIGVNQFIDDEKLDQFGNKQTRTSSVFGFINFSIVAGFEYLFLCMGMVIFLATILSFFVNT